MSGDEGPPRRGLQEPEHQPQGGRFAGAVRTEQAEDFARTQFKVQPVKGQKSAILLGQLFGPEQHHFPFSSSTGKSRHFAHQVHGDAGLGAGLVRPIQQNLLHRRRIGFQLLAPLAKRSEVIIDLGLEQLLGGAVADFAGPIIVGQAIFSLPAWRTG